MKLQLALDELTLPEAMVFMDKVVDDVDIIEVGTPFLIREGVNAIKAIKEKYPHKEVLADAKIMDAAILNRSCFSTPGQTMSRC